MAEDFNVKETERPFQVLGVLDGVENFHTGYYDLPTAQSACNNANEQAVKLGIKTRYVVKEKKIEVV